MYGLLNYMQGMQRNQQMSQMQPRGLLAAMSNQGKLVQPQQMAPMSGNAARALQGAQQNAVIMPKKKKEEGGGGGSMDKMMMVLKFMGMGG